MSTPATDTHRLSIEIDDASGMAGFLVGRALGDALEDAGLETSIEISPVGPTRYMNRRSHPGVEAAQAAVDLTVHELRVYMPPALSGAIAGRLLEALVYRLVTWRRETDNEQLEVPIYGPDGKVLRVIERDVER